MRIDRVATLALHKIPFRSPCKLPILMYHSVTPKLSYSGHPYLCIEICPETFEKHLQYLVNNDYRAIHLRELLEVKKKLPEKCVAITFDDGYSDFYDHALPLLEKYNIKATVTIPAGLIGKENCSLNNKKLLNWDQIRESRKRGIEFGSHSLSHPSLSNCSKKDLEYEIGFSKQLIEQQLGENTYVFSHPYRFPEEKKLFVKQFVQLLIQYGYLVNLTTRIGRVSKNDDLMLLKRLPINEYDDEPLFKAKLEGAYDWLYNFQYVNKILKGPKKNFRSYAPVDPGIEPKLSNRFSD